MLQMSLPIGNRVQAFTWLLDEAPLSLGTTYQSVFHRAEQI